MAKSTERWKEEVKVQEAKSSMNSSKLKSEIESHSETREKLEKTIGILSETRTEIDKTRQEYKDFIQKLKEEKQEQDVKLMIDEAAQSELEKLKVNHQLICEQNEKLTQNVTELQNCKSDLETNLNKLKDTSDEQRKEITDLMAQVAELESVKMRLANEEEKLGLSEAEVQKLISKTFLRFRSCLILFLKIP